MTMLTAQNMHHRSFIDHHLSIFQRAKDGLPVLVVFFYRKPVGIGSLVWPSFGPSAAIIDIMIA